MSDVVTSFLQMLRASDGVEEQARQILLTYRRNTGARSDFDASKDVISRNVQRIRDTISAPQNFASRRGAGADAA